MKTAVKTAVKRAAHLALLGLNMVLFATRALSLAAAVRTPTLTHALRMSTAASSRIAIVGDVEIEPTRVDEFMDCMKIDALGSRKEAGCLRFDLLRDNEKPNRFFFYEIYDDKAAVDVHKATPHFKAWSDFKESGGVLSQTSTKASAPADWAIQEKGE